MQSFSTRIHTHYSPNLLSCACMPFRASRPFFWSEGVTAVSSDLNSRISANSVSATTKAISCCLRLSQTLRWRSLALGAATMAMFGGRAFGLRWLPRDLVRRIG